jgi:hypothetical protein
MTIALHASISNHLNTQRHLVDRQTYRECSSAALAKWQSLAAEALPSGGIGAPSGDELVSDRQFRQTVQAIAINRNSSEDPGMHPRDYGVACEIGEPFSGAFLPGLTWLVDCR